LLSETPASSGHIVTLLLTFPGVEKRIVVLPEASACGSHRCEPYALAPGSSGYPVNTPLNVF